MKVGKAARDIFASTSSSKAPTGAPGAPEPYVKATVVLRTRQVVFLDRAATDLRSSTGAFLARAEFLRAMVDAVMESGFDLTQSTTEEDLKRKLAAKLARR